MAQPPPLRLHHSFAIAGRRALEGATKVEPPSLAPRSRDTRIVRIDAVVDASFACIACASRRVGERRNGFESSRKFAQSGMRGAEFGPLAAFSYRFDSPADRGDVRGARARRLHRHEPLHFVFRAIEMS